MSQPHAIICRFCGVGGGLYKGAHRECKNEQYKQHLRLKYAIPPERWTAQVDCKTTCNTCDVNPREGKSYRCKTCLDEHKKALKKILNRKYRRSTRATVGSAARVCKCGCGRAVVGFRLRYASPACWQKPAKPEKPAKPPVPPRPPQWERKSKRMPDMFIGARTELVERVERIVIPAGLVPRVIPSIYPPSLCETEPERDARYASLRAFGWKGGDR